MTPASEARSQDIGVTTMGTKAKTMEAQILRWRAKIEELSAQARKAGPQARMDYLQRIDDLKARCAVTQSKLDKLKASDL